MPKDTGKENDNAAEPAVVLDTAADEGNAEWEDKAVVVYYETYAEPDEMHPAGVLAGTVLESASAVTALRFHPNAKILRYADGSEFTKKAAKGAAAAAATTTTAAP